MAPARWRLLHASARRSLDAPPTAAVTCSPMQPHLCCRHRDAQAASALGQPPGGRAVDQGCARGFRPRISEAPNRGCDSCWNGAVQATRGAARQPPARAPGRPVLHMGCPCAKQLRPMANNGKQRRVRWAAPYVTRFAFSRSSLDTLATSAASRNSRANSQYAISNNLQLMRPGIKKAAAVARMAGGKKKVSRHVPGTASLPSQPMPPPKEPP